jgi:hypothetical protein
VTSVPEERVGVDLERDHEGDRRELTAYGYRMLGSPDGAATGHRSPSRSTRATSPWSSRPSTKAIGARPGTADHPDAVVSGPLDALIGLCRAGFDIAKAPEHGLRIEGDPAAFQKLRPAPVTQP